MAIFNSGRIGATAATGQKHSRVELLTTLKERDPAAPGPELPHRRPVRCR